MPRWARILGALVVGCLIGCEALPAPAISDFGPPIDGAGFNVIPEQPLPGNVLPIDGAVPLGELFITITERESAAPIPARVIFRPPPAMGFADSLTSGAYNLMSPGSLTAAVVSPGALGSTEGVLLYTGQARVPVPPGTYELFITRGPEYEAVVARVTLAAGETRQVDATLDRTVDTRGWLATDMHIHTARSFDAKLALERRVVSMVTNGIEILVPTDHNVSTDFSEGIALLGYGPAMVGQVIGNEFNFAQGHGGAYPVPYDALKPAGGAPEWVAACPTPTAGINCMPDTMAFQFMREHSGGVAAITINHPYWPGADLGYFTNVGWGVGTANPPPALLPSAGSFDAIELINGYWTQADAIDALRTDWMFLLSQGFRVTALGNSDTHRINWVRAGFPRTWLRLPNDVPGETTGEGLAQAVKQQRAIASTGPFARFTVDGADIGDTVVPKTPGLVTVAMEVDAPQWIAVDIVRLFVNGELKHTYKVTPGTRPRFRKTISEPISGDAYFVLEAEGTTAMPPDVVGEAGGNGTYPRVITNPVFVDADGSGDWHPQSLRPQSLRPSPLRAESLQQPSRDVCHPSEREPPLAGPGMTQEELAPYLFPR